jgi:hypothetical protein
VVAWLIDELIALGHQVTLFASGGSVTGAELVAAWPRALRLGRPRSDPIVAQAALLEVVAQRAAEFDLVHSVYETRQATPVRQYFPDEE